MNEAFAASAQWSCALAEIHLRLDNASTSVHSPFDGLAPSFTYPRGTSARWAHVSLNPTENTMSHPSDVLFERMREVVEAPGYHLLKHYKQDFYKYDRQQLADSFTPDMTYLWVVRKMGTHLFPLYIDPRITNDAHAALSIESSAQDIFIVGPKGLKKIELKRALEELKHYDYTVGVQGVFKMGRLLAEMDVRIVWAESRQKGEVEFRSELPISALTPRDHVALQRIALGQVINKSHSLFTPCTEVTFNGISLFPETQAQEEACPA